MSGPGGRVVIVIPARLASTRLPRKLLLAETGKSVVQHTWERACRVSRADEVLVATDSEEIADVVRGFGGDVVMTSPACASGTDRVAEAVRERPDAAIVVNLQGDEPEIATADVDALIAAMESDPSLPMGTLAAPMAAMDAPRPSVVKVVRDRRGRALYFSRAAIPHVRDADDALRPCAERLRHVGIYAFRGAALLAFAALPPTPLEVTEKLEQLRALENGWAIAVVTIDRAPPGIDTREDYDAFVMRIAGRSGGGRVS